MAELKKLTDFALSQIDKKFNFADFERRVYTKHVKEIKRAIVAGKMIDNIITVHKKNGDKWNVIDGQHRLVALKALYTERNLTTYTLYLRILDDKKIADREAYIAINTGKALTIKDMLKVYDDGSNPFFNELKGVCSHYGSTNTLPYVAALFGYAYTKTSQVFRSKEDIEENIADVKPWDAARIHQFINTMYFVFGRDTRSQYYKAVVFRNLMKVFFEHYKAFVEGDKNFEKFCKKLTNDRYIYANQTIRNNEVSAQMYSYLKNKALSYLGEE
jgi:hypothetical protein